MTQQHASPAADHDRRRAPGERAARDVHASAPNGFGPTALAHRLQRFGGNRATGTALRSVGIQPKLKINEPGDPYEDEADRVAEQVMRMPEPSVQRVASGGGAGAGAEAPPIVHDVLRASGRALDSATRRSMESRFGEDLGDVRVHTDAHAAESAAQVSARAYTVGNHVVFGAGEWKPGGGDGDRLLAHELTHVLQQGGGLHRKPVKPPYRAQLVAPTESSGKPAAIQTCQDVNAKGCRTDVLTAGMEVTVTNEFVGGLWLFVEHLPKEAVAALNGQKWIYVQSKFVKRLPAASAPAKAPQPAAGDSAVQQLSDAIYGGDQERVLSMLGYRGLDEALDLLRQVHAAATAKGQISPVLHLADAYTLTTTVDEPALRVAVAAQTISLSIGNWSGSAEDAHDELMAAAKRLGDFNPWIVSVYLERHAVEPVRSIVQSRRTEDIRELMERLEHSRAAAKDPLGVFKKRLQENALKRLDENELLVKKQRDALAGGAGSDAAWTRLQTVVVPQAINYSKLSALEEKLESLVRHTTRAVAFAKAGSNDAAGAEFGIERGDPPEGAWWRPNRFPMGGGGAEFPPNIEELEEELALDEQQYQSVRQQRKSLQERIPLVKALRPAMVERLKKGPASSDRTAVQRFREEVFAELQKQVFEAAASAIKIMRTDVELGHARLYSFAPLVAEVKKELLLGADAEGEIDRWIKEQRAGDEAIRIVTSALAITLAASTLLFGGPVLVSAIVGLLAAGVNTSYSGEQYVAAKAGMAGKDITDVSVDDARLAANLAILDLVLSGWAVGAAVRHVYKAGVLARTVAEAEQLANARRAAQAALDAEEAAKAAKPIGRPAKGGLTVYEGGGQSTSGPQGKLRAIAGGGETPQPPKPPPGSEPAQMPRLKTGTDASVDVVGKQTEIGKAATIDPAKGPVASAAGGKPPSSTKTPALSVVEGGAASEVGQGAKVTKPSPRGKGSLVTAGTRFGRTYRINADAAEIARSQRGFQVYEYRNARGELLYVGKSGGAAGKKPLSWLDRLRGEHIEKEWIGEARTVTVTAELGEQEALALEEALIPEAKYNVRPGEHSARFPQGGTSASAVAASKHGAVHRFTLDVMF